jgi:hypothetical protein
VSGLWGGGGGGSVVEYLPTGGNCGLGGGGATLGGNIFREVEGEGEELVARKEQRGEGAALWVRVRVGEN